MRPLCGKSHNFPQKATIPHFRGVNGAGQGLNQRFLQLRQRLKSDFIGDVEIVNIPKKQPDKTCIEGRILIKSARTSHFSYPGSSTGAAAACTAGAPAPNDHAALRRLFPRGIRPQSSTSLDIKTPIMTPGAGGMDLIFREVRSQNGWQAKPAGDEHLREFCELTKCTTRTAANRCWSFPRTSGVLG